MHIEILGCSGGFGPGHDTTAFLLNDTILIDAGTGLGRLSPEKMLQVEHVVLTHAHLDHICALPLLQVTIVNRELKPLRIYGSEATLGALHDHIFNDSIWPDFTRIPTVEEPMLHFIPLEQETPTQIGDCSFEGIAVNHTIPAWGYRVTCGSRILAFTGDTTTTDRFWKRLYDIPPDLLIAEVAFSEANRELGRAAKHYTSQLLAADLEKLQTPPRLALSHLQPGRGQKIFEEATVATGRKDLIRLKNGMVLEI